MFPPPAEDRRLKHQIPCSSLWIFFLLQFLILFHFVLNLQFLVSISRFLFLSGEGEFILNIKKRRVFHYCHLEIEL